MFKFFLHCFAFSKGALRLPSKIGRTPLRGATTMSAAAVSATLASQTTKHPERMQIDEINGKKEGTNQEEIAKNRIKTTPSFFTLGYRDAVYQWWNSPAAQAAEHRVLSCIPYLRNGNTNAIGTIAQQMNESDPYGWRVWRSEVVQLSGKNRALNEYSVERKGESDEENLVMLHGYGAGLGFYYQNFEPLTRESGWKLYALDMLGMGNSTRPPFKIYSKNHEAKIVEAEDWFIDALEEWRKIRKLEKFTLLAHSLGGYLAVSYAIKYPGRLNKLILVSPVGIPENPLAVNDDISDPIEDAAVVNEFMQDQEDVARENTGQTKAAKKAHRSGKDKDAAKANATPKRTYHPMLVWLWENNFSPFSLVRGAGPLAPRFISGWTSRRFSHLPEEEQQALHDYTYSIVRQRGSGEYALTYILAPGAYARRPVIRRIQKVGRGKGETGIPVVFMYGDQDWMDVAGGHAAQEKLRQRSQQALLYGTEIEQRNENGNAKVIVVPKAGHHLYLDNSEEFNKAILEELRETKEANKKLRGKRLF